VYIESHSEVSWCSEWRQGVKGIDDVRWSTWEGQYHLLWELGDVVAIARKSLPDLSYLVSYPNASGRVRPNRQWAVLYEHNRWESRCEREKEMRNLTPDDKRIKESQQSTARETTEGIRATWVSERIRCQCRDAIIWHLDEITTTEAPRLSPSWKFHGDLNAVIFLSCRAQRGTSSKIGSDHRNYAPEDRSGRVRQWTMYELNRRKSW